MNTPQLDPQLVRREEPVTAASKADSGRFGNGTAIGAGQKGRRAGRESAAMIAAGFAILVTLWICCSEWLLSAGAGDPHRLMVVRDWAGWALVVVGAVVLYALVKRAAEGRERIEAELEESSGRLRVIGENSAEVIWIYDVAERRFVFASPAAPRVLGLAPEEIAAARDPAILMPVSAHPAAELLSQRIAALEAGDESARVRADTGEFMRKDGSSLFVEAVTTLLTGEDGRAVRVLGVVRNAADRMRLNEEIEGRKQAEERLQEQSTQLAGIEAAIQAQAKIREQAGLLDTANDAIYVTALDGAISYWNQGAERLFGWTSPEALGRTTAELFSRDPKTGDNQTAVLLQRGGWAGEERQRTKSGRYVVVFTRLTLVRGGAGEPPAVFAISSDITEKKRIEAQFLREQRIESLRALAGGMARDLNAVLAPVSLAIPALRAENLSDGSRNLLAAADESVRRGVEIAEQVLIFATGAQGERKPLQPGALLEETAKTARETFPGSIRVDTRVAEDLEPVLGDAAYLRRAILDLCANARDAMPAGGVLTLAAESVTVDEHTARETLGGKAGRHVRLSVADTGGGIPLESLDRIFEPFFTTKRPGRSAGLGLSTVMGIARGHGGFVRAVSTVGQGSRFELFLPAGDPSRPGAGGAFPTRSPFMHGETVLVVDDEVAVCELIRRVLERQGYHVLAATGGEPALHLFEEHHEVIKVVVTDMMMPNVDGPALIRRVREIDPAACIVGISGVGDRAMLDKIESLELAGFLAKPFTVEMLLKLLQKVLNAAPEAAPAAQASRD